MLKFLLICGFVQDVCLGLPQPRRCGGGPPASFPPRPDRRDSTAGGLDIRLSVYGQTDRGLRRAKNEDDLALVDLDTGQGIEPPSAQSIAVNGRGVLLAVCDGVGGRRAGEVASALAIQSLPEELDALGSNCARSEIFRTAVENVSRRVWQESRLDPVLEGMTTTLTAALICRGRAVIAHVGDSRAYVLRGGVMRQITRDHSYVAEMVASGALTREEAEKSPYRNVILQAVGQKKGLEVALDAVELVPGDTLLLCTDGLSEKVPPPEMARLLQSGSLREACEALVALANERGGEDNITVLIGRIEEEAR